MSRKRTIHPKYYELYRFMKGSTRYFTEYDGWMPGDWIRVIARDTVKCFPEYYPSDGSNSENIEMAKAREAIRFICRQEGEKLECTKGRKPLYRFRATEPVTMTSVDRRDKNLGKLIDQDLEELGVDMHLGRISKDNLERVEELRVVYRRELGYIRTRIKDMMAEWDEKARKAEKEMLGKTRVRRNNASVTVH